MKEDTQKVRLAGKKRRCLLSSQFSKIQISLTQSISEYFSPQYFFQSLYTLKEINEGKNLSNDWPVWFKIKSQIHDL